MLSYYTSQSRKICDTFSRMEMGVKIKHVFTSFSILHRTFCVNKTSTVQWLDLMSGPRSVVPLKWCKPRTCTMWSAVICIINQTATHLLSRTPMYRYLTRQLFRFILLVLGSTVFSISDALPYFSPNLVFGVAKGRETSAVLVFMHGLGMITASVLGEYLFL